MQSLKTKESFINQIKKSYFDVDKKNSNHAITRSNDYSIKIANTKEEREAAYRLAYINYLEKGYIDLNPKEWYIQDYDFKKDTIILIVQNQIKEVIGSVTLVFDKSTMLPAENIFNFELELLRKNNFKLAEVSRLVISNEYQREKKVLLLLFNYLCIYIHFVMQYNCEVIEVNPRHKDYYIKTLSFKEIGIEKPCPQVHNAPGILLYLPTNKYQSEIRRCNENLMSHKKERSLYQYFIRPEEEIEIAKILKSQKSKMTIDELKYFGYSNQNLNRTACV